MIALRPKLSPALLAVAFLAFGTALPGAAMAEEATVTIANFAFDPPSVTVAVGSTVTWVNLDAAPHLIAAADGSFRSETLMKSASFSQEFTAAGTFDYACGIHPSMKGTVVVTP